MANTKKFEDLVKDLEVSKLARQKELEIKKLEETKRHEFNANLEIIEEISKVESEQMAQIEITKKKTLNKIFQPISLVILFFICFVIYFFLPQSKIKDIVVVGNKAIETQEILKIANINVNDSIPSLRISSIKTRLEENDIIKSAFIKKDLATQKVYIEIREVAGLFYYENNNGTYLVDLENKVQRLNTKDINFPKFVDYLNVNSEYANQFIHELIKVKPSVLSQISEITYTPTKTFPNRFLLKMNDRNFVYMLSSNVANKLNYYQELRRVIPKDKTVDVYLENADYYKVSQR